MTRARLLLVEDERLIALDVQHRLQRLGYEVVGTAATGEAAIDLARNLRPDVLLMDIQLAGDMDGIEASEIIRAGLDIPVVYLTACSDEQTLQRARSSGPLAFVLKPFGDRELTVAIDMARHKHLLEQQLVEKERLLDTTLASIADAVICLDSLSDITYCNHAALSLLRRTGENLVGLPIGEVLPLFDGGSEVQPCFPAKLAEMVLDCGQPYIASSPYLLALRGGAMIPTALTVSPLRNHNGGYAGTVFVLRDLTERHAAESALQTTVRKLTLALEATVQALAVAAEKRDPYTAGHQQRVAELAVAMAHQLGIANVEGLRVAAILHDLGKICVPAEILSKPTRLTELEMGLVRTHATVGYEILKDIPFPWPVADIVLQHHERLDGSGYPNGLRGQSILPEARILAVADVVEAMSSHRPYRASLGVNAALREITANSGKRYDPDAVEACLTLFARRGFRFGDEPRLAVA